MKKKIENLKKPSEEDPNEFFGRICGIGILVIGTIILMINIR